MYAYILVFSLPSLFTQSGIPCLGFGATHSWLVLPHHLTRVIKTISCIFTIQPDLDNPLLRLRSQVILDYVKLTKLTTIPNIQCILLAPLPLDF